VRNIKWGAIILGIASRVNLPVSLIKIKCMPKLIIISSDVLVIFMLNKKVWFN
jgi:hypothetical protein